MELHYRLDMVGDPCRLSVTLYYLARYPSEELGGYINILLDHSMPHLIYLVVVLATCDVTL